MTFDHAAEKASGGDSGRSRVASINRQEILAERLHPKAAYSSLRPKPAAGEFPAQWPVYVASAIAFAALVIGGSMLLMTPMGGWHDVVGEAMLITGTVGMLITAIRALRRDHGRR